MYHKTSFLWQEIKSCLLIQMLPKYTVMTLGMLSMFLKVVLKDGVGKRWAQALESNPCQPEKHMCTQKLSSEHGDTLLKEDK